MDLRRYLERIDVRGPLTPSADTLRRLHLAHLLAIPFENLSIHAGEPIVLDDATLFEKVVVHRRGGFCYELNGLFAALLRELGFRVSMLAAEVAKPEGGYGLPFDHMTLLVELEERWLADVGFGDSFCEPLRLDTPDEQVEGERAYRIDMVEGHRMEQDHRMEQGRGIAQDHRVLMRREGDGPWIPQYRFDLEPHVYADYAAMCHYHQTSPESSFTRRRICSRATPTGRVTLSGLRLIVTNHGERQERDLSGEEESREVLRQRFGIVMPG